jgi:hypothetical protein
MNSNIEFLNFLFPKSSKLDFVVSNVSFNAKEFAEWIEKNKDKAEANKGYLQFDILRSGKDPNKFYARVYNSPKKEPVSTQEHMPDRETSDLPF